jgi:hypothetical protein
VNLSQYFEDLNKAYRAELDDMQTDSQGNNVFAARLKEKRQQFTLLMPMIAFAPEMVAPAFHTGVSFDDPHAMMKLSFLEPEEFPSWLKLTEAIRFEAWAEKLVAIAVAEPGGERFLSTTMCLEFLHGMHSAKHTLAHDAAEQDDDGEGENAEEHDHNEHNERNEGDDRDLEAAGADWLAEQGFDRRE